MAASAGACSLLWVVALNGEGRVVGERGDLGAVRLVQEDLPAGLGRDPESALGGVLVAIFEQGVLVGGRDAVVVELALEFLAPGLDRVADLLEEE
jgi:hypothetical protein